MDQAAKVVRIERKPPDRLGAMAAAIQRQASKHGAVVVLRDDEGRAHVIPGFDFELVGLYVEGVKAAWIREDLEHAEVNR